MPTVIRPSGLTISAPDTYRIDEPAGDTAGDRPRRGPARGRTSGPVPMPSIAAAGGGSDSATLLAALAGQDFALVDSVELQPTIEPTPPEGRRRSAAPPIAARQDTTLELTVAPDEDAVLLVEQDGVFSWNTAAVSTPQPSDARVRGRAGRGQKRLQFTVEVRASREGGAPARRGLVSEIIYDQITVHVLKFVARVAIGSSMKFLERNVRRGVVLIRGLDPAAWPLLTPGMLSLPQERPARVLLFVHGTFSSTIGSFGALAGTPWGQAFLDAVSSQYDAVLGFDHATLADDPMTNATELLAALESLGLARPPRIDVIAFSRGGLVFRTLVEHLLPRSTFKGRIDRVVFVACTNGGTQLAEPENWGTLIDLYTNLAVGAFRLLTLLPQAAGPALVLKELVQGVGALVKHLATYASADVPGLAAMRPSGDFITTLNTRQPEQPEPGASAYFAVTSEFAPSLSGAHEPRELPRRLLMAIADGLVQRVMGEANDLVVNTKSMTAIDEGVGLFVRDTFAFGSTATVYHTTYFARPEVVNALTRWLELTQPAEADAPGRGASTRRGALPPMIGPRELSVPAAVDTNISVADAQAPARDAAALIEAEVPSYVVVRRHHPDRWYHYAMRPDEVLELASRHPDEPLGRALDLHEHQASQEQQVTAVAPVAPGMGRSSTGRAVVFSGDAPIGVIAAPSTGAGLDIVALARAASSLATFEERVAARGAMPSFAPPQSGAASMELDHAITVSKPIRITRGARTTAPQAGGASVDTTIAAVPASARVECHFLAEMDQEVMLNHTATIEVSVSREQLTALADRAAAMATGIIDPTAKLLVQVVPRTNFVLVEPSQDRVELDAPEPGQPVPPIYFDVKAAHAGAGEVWILVRQRQMGVARLVLQPSVVERKDAGKARRVSASADVTPAPPMRAPVDQLNIFEQTVGDTVQYLFELEMPSLNVLEMHASKPLKSKRDDYVKSLYKEIEDRYLSTFNPVTQEADVEAFTAELQAYGATLFDDLIPPPIQQLLWTHRDVLKSVRVVSAEPFIPWEILHLREPGKPVNAAEPSRFLGQMGLVRWLHNVNGLPPSVLRIREGRARYVIPVYAHPDWALPETANERMYLETSFHATAIEPQPNPLRKTLSEGGTFDLLHFACHGEAESDNISYARVVLEGRVEGPNFVPAHLNASTVETFGRLKGADGVQPLVFLNACQAGRAGYKLTGIGGFAQAFLRAGAGAFVGTLWSVGDQPAFWFGERFYESLRGGESLASATVAAREAARAGGDSTWLAYVVYGHPHATLEA